MSSTERALGSKQDNIGIPVRSLYKVDRLLTAQQKGTTARWNLNKTSNIQQKSGEKYSNNMTTCSWTIHGGLPWK